MNGRVGSRRRRERGHLLLDYFVGATVFLAAFGSFIAATNIRVRGLGEAERRVRAVDAAESVLAAFEAGEPDAARVAHLEGLPNSAVDVHVVPREGLRSVTVKVTWTELDGSDQKVELATVAP